MSDQFFSISGGKLHRNFLDKMVDDSIKKAPIKTMLEAIKLMFMLLSNLRFIYVS